MVHQLRDTLIDGIADETGATNPSRAYALGVLSNTWGHSEFRRGQWPVIRSLLSGRDTVAILPTGTGKSICYQVPGLVMQGTTIVISPLIALMRDQVDSLRVRGVSAVAINSSMNSGQRDRAWNDAKSGGFKFIYVSPELLQTDRFQMLLNSIPITFVAVDEAHCIAEWGRRFRPAYRRIASAVPDNVPRIALTATASRSVQREIRRVLRLRNPLSVITGYDRPNLFWAAKKVHTFGPYVAEYVDKLIGPVVIYCMTRRAVEWWATWLRNRSIPTSYYHGGLGRKERDRAQTDWLCGRTRVMVATNAFGMGIDKPDVRLVMHIGLPANMSSYYQEAGRAGRDGKPARVSLLFQPADVMIRKKLIMNGPRRVGPSSSAIQAARRFSELMQYLRSPTCRRRFILNYFGEAYNRECGNCDICQRHHAVSTAMELRQIAKSHTEQVVDQATMEAVKRFVREGLVEYLPSLTSAKVTTRGERALRSP